MHRMVAQDARRLKMKKVSCECGFTDEYDSEELGLSYYQAIGTCPECGADLGTSEIISIHIINDNNAITTKGLTC